jgi:threonine/homoserine/homoserine lactone efflux protein
MENPLLFALMVLAVLAAPGPTNTLLAISGAAEGMRRAYFLIPAEALGYFIAILTLRLVLGPLVESFPVLVTALRILAGTYLLWVSWRLWSRGRAQVTEKQRVITAGQVFLTTLMNPKSVLFALGIIPFGVPHPYLYLLSFQLLAAAIATAWIGGGAVLGRMAQNRVRFRLIPCTGAVVLGVFALTLLASPLLH